MKVKRSVADMNKLTRAFACAPLIPGVSLSLLMFHPAPLLIAVPLGYMAMAIVGVPIYWLTRRYWRLSLTACACGGALAGAIVCLVVGWAGNALEGTAPFAMGLLLFVLLGMLTGAGFWLFGGGIRTRGADVPA